MDIMLGVHSTIMTSLITTAIFYLIQKGQFDVFNIHEQKIG